MPSVRKLAILGTLAAVLSLLSCSPAGAMRLYKSRADALTMLGEKESRIYFHTCEQSSSRTGCVMASDMGTSQEPTQCAWSHPEDRPWWLAVLEVPAYITTVTILNMDPIYRSFMDGLSNMTIMVADEVCFRHASQETFVKRIFPCDTVGDQITIQSELPNAVMALCDVEVHGVPLKFATALEQDKVLSLASCQQSTVDGSGYCEKAFDGDTGHGSCSTTMAEEVPYLEVTLALPSVVNRISIFAGPGGLSHINVTLNNRKCFEYKGDPFESKTFECKYFGDTLRITGMEQTPLKPLTVCEVQMLGHAAALGEPDHYKPLGCHKDSADSRDLPDLVSSTHMSLQKCHRMCKRSGVKFFGVQNGRHCFCGSSHGKHGAAADSECAVRCEGNEETICGGALANSVYEIV